MRGWLDPYRCAPAGLRWLVRSTLRIIQTGPLSHKSPRRINLLACTATIVIVAYASITLTPSKTISEFDRILLTGAYDNVSIVVWSVSACLSNTKFKIGGHTSSIASTGRLNADERE
jgi:hypothetical protein